MSSVVDSGLAPIILLAAIGLVLWGVGIRIIRAAFAAVSLFIGALVGWALGGLMPESLGLPPWAMILLCAVLLACLAALAYRFAVAVCLAGLMAAAGPLAVRVTADVQPGWFGAPATATDDRAGDPGDVPALVGETDDEPDAAADDPGIIDLLADEDLDEPEDRWWERDRVEPEVPAAPDPEAADDPAPGDDDPAADDPFPDDPVPGDPAGDDIARELVLGEAQARVEQGLQRLGEDLGIEAERTEASIDRFGVLLDRAGREVIEMWEQTPARIRPTLIAAGVLGALLGILLAALGPNLSAALLTALGGAAMWLACGFVLVERGGIADESWLPGSLPGWAAWWMAASIIGLAIQWTLRPKVADKSAD